LKNVLDNLMEKSKQKNIIESFKNKILYHKVLQFKIKFKRTGEHKKINGAKKEILKNISSIKDNKESLITKPSNFLQNKEYDFDFDLNKLKNYFTKIYKSTSQNQDIQKNFQEKLIDSRNDSNKYIIDFNKK